MKAGRPLRPVDGKKESTEFVFRERVDGKWREVDLSTVVGKTIRELFLGWEGREVVAKATNGFICGTKEWIDHYKARGDSACSFVDAVAILERRGETAALGHIVWPEEWDGIFEGATLKSVTETKQHGS
jgi:hypothetical protein